MDLSVLIPARNERWLARTVADVLAHAKADTEVIAVCDGQWADPPLPDLPRLRIVRLPAPIGQRAATNLAARMSRAEFVMKLDAHVSVADGFDRVLIDTARELGRDVTQIPRMFNLHVFDWQCGKCQNRTYQGPKPTRCEACKTDHADFTLIEVWQPRLNRCSDFMRFDHDLHFQYWSAMKKRPETKADIVDIMSSVGACFFMSRDRFWELGGLDETHGSWGAFGVEIACKSWLSGGRHVVNKRTHFSHLFRTQPGFGFPYPQSGSAQEKAREHSRKLWLENTWPGQVRPLSWLIEKFAPIPDWSDPIGAERLALVKAAGERFMERRAA